MVGGSVSWLEVAVDSASLVALVHDALDGLGSDDLGDARDFGEVVGGCGGVAEGLPVAGHVACLVAVHDQAVNLVAAGEGDSDGVQVRSLDFLRVGGVGSGAASSEESDSGEGDGQGCEQLLHDVLLEVFGEAFCFPLRFTVHT